MTRSHKRLNILTYNIGTYYIKINVPIEIDIEEAVRNELVARTRGSAGR